MVLIDFSYPENADIAGQHDTPGLHSTHNRQKKNCEKLVSSWGGGCKRNIVIFSK
jgi:hypothetical protein